MLQLLYNNEFLTLAAGQQAEVERTNPMYAADQYLAENSTPIILPYSEVNAAHFGHLYQEQTNKAKLKINVQVFDAGTYVCNAVMVINGSDMNFIYNGKAACKGYLLTGLSAFASQIQNKKLKELSYGGERVYTTANIAAHIADTANYTFDYVYAPVMNDKLTGDDSAYDWMNKVVNGAIEPFLSFYFPKLEYVLRQIFIENGWTLDTTRITDIDWKRLVIFGFGETINYLLAQPVDNNWRIQISRALPQEMNCSTFILQVCKKYGWAPIFNAESRNCTIIPLAENNEVEDWTEYAQPGSTSDYKEQTKVVKFTNDFEGNDPLPNNPDTMGFDKSIIVASKFALPTPIEAYDKHLIYSQLENIYWGITLDEATNTRVWYPFSDNMYSEVVEDATHTFETSCTTLPMRWVEFGTENNQIIYALVPVTQQPFNKTWGLKTLFFHGVSRCRFANGQLANTTYPMLSSLYTNSEGVVKTAWSNVISHKISGGVDKGIKQYWFATWLALNKSLEEIERYFTLPKHKLLQLKWDSIKLINNIPYLLKSYIETLPYNYTVKAKLQLLTIGNTQAALPPAPVQTIYIRLVSSNLRTGQGQTNTGISGTSTISNASILAFDAYTFSDAAGTIPLSVTNLTVLLRTVTTVDNVAFDDVIIQQVMNGTSTDFGVFHDVYTEYDYDFTPAPGWTFGPPQPIGHYITVRSLANNGNAYVIIP